MTEYGRIHTDGSRSGGQPIPSEMTNDERAALARHAPKVILDAIGELALSIKPHYMDQDQRRRMRQAIETLVDLLIKIYGKVDG